MALAEIINGQGVRAVARACGVDAAAVVRWKVNGLPSKPGYARSHYERQIAKLAGMSVAELRKEISEAEDAV